MTVIRLAGMEFFARVGHSPAERDVGGRIQVDVEMDVEQPQTVVGRLKGTVDYAEVHRVVRQTVTSREHVLLEDLAVRLLDALGAFGARRTTVRVRKPNPPLVEGVVAAAEVEMTRASRGA